MATIWLGSSPKDCDVCDMPLLTKFYDARTKQGPWGNMCLPCFKVHGIGLGLGKGQEYTFKGDFHGGGKWIKTGG